MVGLHRLLTLVLVWSVNIESVYSLLPGGRQSTSNHVSSQLALAAATTRDIVDQQKEVFDYDYDCQTHVPQIQMSTPLERGDGILYRQSVFSPDEWQVIRNELTSLLPHLHEETTSSVAQQRRGATLPRENPIVTILREGSMSTLVKKLVGESVVLSSNLPVEVRTYEKVGACMAWHEDDVLYNPAQVEAVITLENNSDCITMWKETSTGLVKSQETDPNSVLLLQAGGPSHCVTPLKRGRRVILKCAYAAQSAVFQDNCYTKQFGVSRGGDKTKTKKSRKQRKKKR